jgi:hypothetical protein
MKPCSCHIKVLRRTTHDGGWALNLYICLDEQMTYLGSQIDILILHTCPQ